MNNTVSAKIIIEKFALSPHPEGGYFRENYRASEVIPAVSLPCRFNGERNYSTAIYFLLERDSFSAFHTIRSDECWHFYAGDTLLVHLIHLDGRAETITLGGDIIMGEQVQAIVPAGCWFAAEPAPGSAYAFVGCTVAPGFDFKDFQLADKAVLAEQFPRHATITHRLTR
ncbi:MAG: cupin domain-containing protein [Ferruginibacter sp.]